MHLDATEATFAAQERSKRRRQAVMDAHEDMLGDREEDAEADYDEVPLSHRQVCLLHRHTARGPVAASCRAAGPCALARDPGKTAIGAADLGTSPTRAPWSRHTAGWNMRRGWSPSTSSASGGRGTLIPRRGATSPNPGSRRFPTPGWTRSLVRWRGCRGFPAPGLGCGFETWHAGRGRLSWVPGVVRALGHPENCSSSTPPASPQCSTTAAMANRRARMGMRLAHLQGTSARPPPARQTPRPCAKRACDFDSRRQSVGRRGACARAVRGCVGAVLLNPSPETHAFPRAGWWRTWGRGRRCWARCSDWAGSVTPPRRGASADGR